MSHPEWHACDCIDLTAHELRIEVERLKHALLAVQQDPAKVDDLVWNALNPDHAVEVRAPRVCQCFELGAMNCTCGLA